MFDAEPVGDMGFETLVYALPENGDWKSVPLEDWMTLHDAKGKRRLLIGLRGPVRFMVFVLKEGHAVNAVPHHLLINEDGYLVADLSLSEEDAKRMDELWLRRAGVLEFVTPEQKADNAEYHELGERGYQQALPDTDAIRKLLRLLLVPIGPKGGIWHLLESAGLRTDAKISDAVCWNKQGEMPLVWRN